MHKAAGLVVSETVTVAVQLAVLPLASLTVRVTVLLPASVQTKSVLSRLRLSTPQLSVELLPTWAVVRLASPSASR